jgi:hypothetical protein
LWSGQMTSLLVASSTAIALLATASEPTGFIDANSVDPSLFPSDLDQVSDACSAFHGN